ncbi:hypothetical protein PIB30_030024 [Stylosanthes scabra]|uniref:Uncharacterized protein n=1 Tax=Stylosanthes scabra TaxID=79078 RepID=A0ABU6RBR0_9FABA|nr:hypothetical protein [Stylosanthes scabra]
MEASESEESQDFSAKRRHAKSKIEDPVRNGQPTLSDLCLRNPDLLVRSHNAYTDLYILRRSFADLRHISTSNPIRRAIPTWDNDRGSYTSAKVTHATQEQFIHVA